LTQANTGDHTPQKNKKFPENIFGKLVADKGYISQRLFEVLFVNDIHLITRIRKNMKNTLMHLRDKNLLRKGPLIETVNDELKNIVQIEHTRHRSTGGVAANLMAAMAAYSFLPQKNFAKYRNHRKRKTNCLDRTQVLQE